MMRCALTLALAPTLAVAAVSATADQVIAAGELTITKLPRSDTTGSGQLDDFPRSTALTALEPVIPVLELWRQKLEALDAADQTLRAELKTWSDSTVRRVREAISAGRRDQRDEVNLALDGAKTDINLKLTENYVAVKKFSADNVNANKDLVTQQIDVTNHILERNYALQSKHIVVQIDGANWKGRFAADDHWQYYFSYVVIPYKSGEPMVTVRAAICKAIRAKLNLNGGSGTVEDGDIDDEGISQGIEIANGGASGVHGASNGRVQGEFEAWDEDGTTYEQHGYPADTNPGYENAPALCELKLQTGELKLQTGA